MKDHKLNFLYNKRKGVPLLRGRIYILNLFMLPLFYFKYLKLRPDYLSRLSIYIYLLGILLHTVACVVFHASSGNTFYRSVLRRIDYGAIFLINITNAFPAFVHFIEKDKHVIMLVFHLLINFYGKIGPHDVFLGMFACLLMNFIFTEKSLRIFLFWISHSICNFVPYKFYMYKMHMALFYYVFGYIMVATGVLVYYLEKPNFFKGMFEFHELSHLLYTLSSICIFMWNGIGMGLMDKKIEYLNQ
ncbi:conserved hypothetical protein [Theileria orientalis strain Shintoku]|uniref:Hemolysin III n=1 Tax=Theileria orientalis strain Shintoku TaxID=869250 RepID=J7MGW2_THEOR|nr:conserved hypothetical protein [Theileria orientalis strain Shintoku]BAM42336.1 conserved hypothetical protein [Theileria orientalis strain Shintoku]|eukprot:XP_009692637.1 conserved hypothetical protein [Theileria orientalis strain Shintoku]